MESLSSHRGTLPQTALMLAAMHGRTECVRRLLDAGANVRLTATVLVIGTVLGASPEPNGVFRLCVQILMFDSSHGRTCLHYAAYYGHSDCLRAVLTAARTAPVSQSWLALLLRAAIFRRNALRQPRASLC